MRLLLEEGHDSAIRYLDQNLAPEIEKAKRDLEALHKEYTTIRGIVDMTRPQSADTATVSKPQLQGQVSDFKLNGDPNDPRSQVLQIAAEVARANDGIAKLDDVLAAMKERKLELDTTRPGTSVANILFKAHVLWERTGPGVFRLIG
jgi:hypothetical protein